jgi:hypothetical protein
MNISKRAVVKYEEGHEKLAIEILVEYLKKGCHKI